jgi:hypothetical protein
LPAGVTFVSTEPQVSSQAQSFQVAMFQVESSYRGGAKPPRSECVQSQKMYNELMGGIR